MLEKENPDLYKKIYEPEKLIEKLAENVSENLTLNENISDAVVSEGKTETEETSEDAEKKHQSRGGKGLIRDESVKLDKEAQKRAVIFRIIKFF